LLLSTPMNTKLVMTLCAIFLAVTGLSLTFLPEEISAYMNISSAKPFLLILQILGALYLSFAMLNWMIKGSLIGGIYNKPIAIANFMHFFVAGLALIKGLMNHPDLPYSVWAFAGIYSIFALLFGLIAFRHPKLKPEIH
jgi:hypothetical protein